MKKLKKIKRMVKWIIELSNHTDHRDNESYEVFAYDYEGASEIAHSNLDKSRFSIRDIRQKHEK